MQTTMPIVVGLLLVALLTLVCSCHVERDVLEKGSAAVAAADHDWATARADGRFIRLSGTAPSPSSVTAAIEAAGSPDAVTRVIDETQLRPVTDADLSPVRGGMARARLRWVNLGWRDWTLQLSGLAPSEDDKRRAQAVAEPLWPWGPVENQIRVPGQEADQQALSCRSAVADILAVDAVQFATDSAELSPQSHRLLDRISTTLKQCGTTAFEVEAHSDDTGEADYNQTLSQSRAESVVAYLVAAGVASEQMTPVGFGESRPIADNATPEGRAQNRRVEFRLVN